MGISELSRYKMKGKLNMKIQNHGIVNQDDIKKIVQLNESVKGSSEYMRYYMEESWKHNDTPNGGFTNWKFLGFGVPYIGIGYEFHIVKDHAYIQSFPKTNQFGKQEIERYYITKAIMEEMGWYL